MSTCLTDFECVKSSQVKSSQVKSSQVKSSEGEREAGTKCGQLPGQSFSSITSPNAAVPRPTLHRLRDPSGETRGVGAFALPASAPLCRRRHPTGSCRLRPAAPRSHASSDRRTSLARGSPRLATQLETRGTWRWHSCCSCTSSTWMPRGADGGSTHSIGTNTWLLSWRAGFQCALRTQRTERSC